MKRPNRTLPEPVPPRPLSSFLADGAVFVLALLAYFLTAAPDVLPADGGEFQLVAALLGVAHPPGFPLYTLAGHLFIRLLPFGTPAYRLNLMSGLLAAAALVWTARATRRWAVHLGASSAVALGGGLLAALTLGTATTFWAQATIANVRTPAVLFAAWGLDALARLATAADRRAQARALTSLALALGLGGSHYPPLAFVALFFALYAWQHLTPPRPLARPLLAGLLGFGLPLLYLPIRGAMGAPQAPPGLDTWPGFLHHFLAKGFAGDMFAFANSSDLPHRLALLPTLFPFQFHPVLLLAALLGLLGLLRRDRRLFLLLAGSLTLHTFVSITYRAPQTVEYLMPAYLPVAVAVGLLPALLPRSLGTLTAIALLLAGLANGRAHAPSFLLLAHDRTARQTVGPLLETAPSGARLLADWRWVTPLRYLQQVEGIRPDVEVVEVYPVAGEEYRATWLRRVQETPPGQPLLLTHFYRFDGYTAEPWQAGFLLHRRPVTVTRAPLTALPTDFGGQVHLVGYALRGERPPHPGGTVEFTLAWQQTGDGETPPSFTLRLLDADGRLVAQADRRLESGLAPGEVRFERLTLPLYFTLTPGRYQVTLGAYTVTPDGFQTLPAADGAEAVPLTELELAPVTAPPFTLNPLDVTFGSGPTLVGVDYDAGRPGTLRVYLRWRGPAAGGQTVTVRGAYGAAGSTPLPPIPDGAYQTIVVDLDGGADDRLWLTLGGREVRLPRPPSEARFIPLGDAMAVVGARSHAAADGTIALDVDLVSLRPLTVDYRTSVRLVSDDGRWLATHDCQPALGAVPTLKWIRGSRVTDRHLLHLPDDFTGGEVEGWLVAYDWFRMEPLPPLDGRFGAAPLGQYRY